LREYPCDPPGPDGDGPDGLGVDVSEHESVTQPLGTELRLGAVGWDTHGRFVVADVTGIELDAPVVEVDTRTPRCSPSRFRPASVSDQTFRRVS